MFSTLTDIGEWHGTNPLENVSALRSPAAELRYLEKTEIEALLNALKKSDNESVWLCTVLALSTGARWSEAENIEIRQVIPGAVRYHTSKDSAGGKWRSVPISPELEKALRDQHKKDSTTQRLFAPCYSAFREAIKRAKIDLPNGQLTHVLRHTFATTFLASGGDLRTLKDLLGHESIQMTMRYAHLVEAHLTQARQFNPIAQMGTFSWNAASKRQEAINLLIKQVELMVQKSGRPRGFNPKTWVDKWIQTQLPALGGKAPQTLLDTDDGLATVKKLIAILESGAYL